MEYHIIQSGSKGNATIIYDVKTTFIIDMGISFSSLKEGLNEINKNIEDISFALITHNHSDHIGGIRFLKDIEKYGPKDLYKRKEDYHSLDLFKEYEFSSFKITPLKTSHDAINSCGYLIKSENETLVYITDTGIFPNEDFELCKNATYYIFESNHDISMLLKTNRPKCLKDRILSDHGHLCNEDSAIAITSLIGDNTKEITLAHISEEANDPEVALKAYKKIFDYFEKDISKYNVRVASQRHSLHGGKNGN